ncbi:TRAP transporter substrate-binding protein [Desulfovibrio aminophilus]|nr:TRAP transporter substrate-binding protein [Desulfovibrio aminophilus]MCM0755963.1 TRAP transporter substrate-binding protein [Desulfovibrio aminophilus]
MRTTIRLAAALLAAAILLVGCGRDEPKAEAPKQDKAAVIRLSYANFPPASTFPCVQMERWKQEVERRTNGRVVVDTYPGGTLLEAKNMFKGVQDGQADIGCLSMSYQPGVFPMTTVAEQPVGFRSSRTASLVLFDLFQKYDPTEFKAVKVLTLFTSAPSNIMSTVPVKSLADLAGLELRASGTPSKMLSALGATPVSMPMSQAPEALQKGLVKGLLSSLEVLKDFNFAESCRYETVTDFPVYPFAVVMNRAKWDSLPADVKAALDGLAREQSEWTGAYMDGHVHEALTWSKNTYDIQIFELSEAERAQARDKTAGLIEEWKAQATAAGVPADAVLADLYRLKAEHEAAEAK